MKPTLEQSLHTQFPFLHPQHTFSEPQSPMSVELTIGDGWYPLYYKLCNELHCIIDIKELEPQAFHFTTVKQKFGLLRVYMDARTEGTTKAIARAVEESRKTCERCGGEGKLYEEERWMRVRCEGCRRADKVDRAARMARYMAQGNRRDSGYSEVVG